MPHASIMKRPVTSRIMQDTGWTRTEFDRRDKIIMTAAMQVFPTRTDWHSRSKDDEQSSRLIEVMRPVALHFSKIGNNGWYVQTGDNLCKAGDYSDGLTYACVQWARGQMSYRYTRYSGWWDSNGSKIEDQPNRSLVLKLRIASRGSANQAERTCAELANAMDEKDSTSPLSTPPVSENADDESMYGDSPTIERTAVTDVDGRQIAQQDFPRITTLDEQGSTGDHNDVVLPSDYHPPAPLAPLPRNHVSAVVKVATDWAELSINIDASSIGKENLWIVMQYLLPDSKAAPTWRDFEYQKFLDELVEVTDSHKLEQGQHDLIYMDGMRRHPIRNKHDYAIMLKKFSESRLVTEDTIDLKLEKGNCRGLEAIDVKPFVMDMSAFRPHVSVEDQAGDHSERDTSEGTRQASTERDGAGSGDPPSGVLSTNIPPRLTAQLDTIEHDLVEQEEEQRLLGPAVHRDRERYSGPTRKRTPTLKRREMDVARDTSGQGESTAGRPSKQRAQSKRNQGLTARRGPDRYSSLARRRSAVPERSGTYDSN